MDRTNAHGQPIGRPVDLVPPPAPAGEVLIGDEVRLRPLRPTDTAALLEAVGGGDGSQWTYLSFGPCTTPAELEPTVRALVDGPDQVAYLVEDLAGTALGTASLMRITPATATIEVGSIVLGPALRRSRAATEAMYLLMRHAFDLGYRRYEWKCDALNAPSRAAAERLGFVYEGTFRNALVYKGRNRDTAWFSVTDEEWPVVRQALETWLAETPLGGEQQRPLAAVRGALVHRQDPAGLGP